MKDFFRRYGWLYLPGLLFLGLSSWLQTWIPRLLGTIIDDLNHPALQIRMASVWQGLLLMMLAAVGTFFTRFIWRSFIMGNSRNLENWLRERLFAHLLILPISFYQHQKTGNLMAYAINDIGAIRQTFGPGLALSANAIVVSILAIFNMSEGVHPKLTLLVLLPLPPVLIMIFLLGRQIQRRFRRVQETFSAVSDRVQESISGIQVIKAYGQETEESRRFEDLNKQSMATQMNMARISASMSPMIDLLFGFSFSIGLIYGGWLVLDKTISLGEFVAFNGYLTLIVGPVQSVARIINLLQKGLASFKRYQQILQTPAAVQDHAAAQAMNPFPGPSQGLLQVSHLTFSFPEQSVPVLQDVSFTLKPGHSLGIMGKTGSGKTVLANLLVRLYDVEPGSIRLDGRDLTDWPLAWLRSQIAVAPQDNFLFSTSLMENIRFFDDKISQEEVDAAARIADLHDAVLGFPHGYETIIGERGVTLSGGQKQRVSLARALVSRAPVLVLDDVLSAVDTETEQRILSSLRAEVTDRALLVIANRVSALKSCDEILVLERGCVVERGTHEQLCAAHGFYASIVKMQGGGPT